MATIKSYSELLLISSFEDRFKYLSDGIRPSKDSFGLFRYLNQRFYSSRDWKNFRNYIIIRDNACDMAHPDHPVDAFGVIHHINPLEIEDLANNTNLLMDPENVIFVAEFTHKAIHNKNYNLLPRGLIERTPNDTSPWLL